MSTQPTWSGDLWGGVASMLVALPAAIAFGVLIFSAIDPALAPSGAAAGALGAAVLGLVSPWIGRNGGMVTGPCAPAAAVTSGLAGSLAATGTPAERILPLLALMAALSGVLQALYGLVGLGRLMKYLPYQVVSGFLSGVAVIIALGQTPKLVGVGSLAQVLQPELWHWQALVVGLVTMGTVFLAPRVTDRVPAPVLGLAAGIACYGALAAGFPQLRVLEGNNLVIGSLSGASPLQYVLAHTRSLLGLAPTDVALVVASSATLSALLSIDTLKTAVVLDSLTGTRHDSNRELVAQGIANIASAGLGGIPGGGTMGPTLVNVTSGGRRPWSGFFEGVMALLAFAVLTPLLAWIPIGALAGLLLVVAYQMFDWRSLRLLLRSNTRFDFVVIATVVAVAIGVGLIEASLVGTGMAILLFTRDQALGSVVATKRDLTHTSSRTRRSRRAQHLLDEHGREGLLVELTGNLFFGTTDQLYTELAEDLGSRRFILLDLRRVASMDYTAGNLLRQMHQRLREHDGGLLFSGMPSAGDEVPTYLEELGLIGSDEGIPVFRTRNDALAWMEDRILQAYGEQAEPESAPAAKLGELQLFQRIEPDAVAALERSVRVIELQPGEELFARKDEGTELYLVAKGAIDILLPLKGGATHHLATLTRGDHLGEMSFLEGHKRTADAKARRASVLYAIDRPTFDALAADHPRLAERVFATLATGISHRLRKADKELRALEDR